MRHYKIVKDGYILLIGIGNGGEEITEKEYNAIQYAIANKPTPTETTDYMLTVDLEWVAFAVEPVEVDDADAEEIVDILTGVSE